ncbi:XRE family transcriptional regulator [Candidatus Falkowbacteria bacterium]|nr:XRE family transcriptional regulator [Candidatus Falkowbacteria bacterium]
MRGIYAEQYKEIGSKIAFYRQLRGLTQQNLADKTDYSLSYITKIEAPNSKSSFSLDVIFKVADALDVDPAAFFNQIEIENKYLKKK